MWLLPMALVQHIGWQRALLVLALINFLVCVPLHGLVLPRRSPDAPSLAGLSANTASPQLLRDPIFYGLCIAFTGNALVYSAMAVHLIPVLHAKGMTVAQAAWIGALIGPMQVLGRLLEYGFLARTSPSRVGALAMWLLPMALVLLSVLSGPSAWFLLFALFYGMGNGVMTIVRGALPAEIYGRSNYGAVNGAMAAPVLFARAAGPIAAALVMASFASPAQTVWLMALVGALSSVLFVATLARRPGAARSA
jgi:predicted MFS family arabinose efflux permease